MKKLIMGIVVFVIILVGAVALWHNNFSRFSCSEPANSSIENHPVVTSPPSSTYIYYSHYTNANVACAIKSAKLSVKNDCRRLRKDFGIDIILPVDKNLYLLLPEDALFIRDFVNNCYKNPHKAKEIGRLLQNGNAGLHFSNWNHSPQVITGCVMFPTDQRWIEPDNVLLYLNSPYEYSSGPPKPPAPPPLPILKD